MLDNFIRRNHVVSLFDYTGDAVRPWAEAGYECFCYDLQHTQRTTEGAGLGSITYVPWDSDVAGAYQRVVDAHVGRAAFLFSFPPCTDLAVSGARHWAAKRERDPLFQVKAVRRAKRSDAVAFWLRCPFLIENQIGALATLWRRPNHKFDPCDYGGYLPEDDVHPRWGDVIPARDAYRKRTCLWTGNGFVMPVPLPVEPITNECRGGNGKVYRGSPQWRQLGGKSERTKNIRSATPRGFARAVFLANAAVQVREAA